VIVYNGIQDYEAIGLWGGKGGLRTTQLRNQEKWEKCDSNDY
jgi:hypothetical protein